MTQRVPPGIFRRFIVIGAAFSLVMNLVLLVPSLFMLQVFDRVLISRSIETLWMLALITTLWLGLGLVLDVLRQRVLGHAAAHLDTQLGATLLVRLLGRAAAPGRGIDMGQLRDLGVVRAFLAGPAILALFDLPWIVVYLAVITLFHPLLGLIAAAAALLLVALAFAADRLSAAPAGRAQQIGGRAGNFVQGSVRAADAVAAHGMAGGIASHWLADHAEAQREGRAAARVTAGVSGFVRFLRQLLQVVMLSAGAWLVIELNVSPGVTIAATILLGRMLAPLEAISSHWKSIGESRAAWSRLRAELHQAGLDAQAFVLPSPTGRLELSGVSFSPAADRPPTLRNVNLVVEPGEVLVVLGASGSGKSTLARLMTGVWAPTAGTVRLDGIDLATWDRAQLGPHIGFCPQDVQLIGGTVAQNIARFGTAQGEDVVDAARRARCTEMIARLPRHFDTDVGDAGALLSGGQRQRVALARALYGRPQLVVLDEPDASLDEEGERRLDAVLRMLRDDKVTTVVITHRAQAVEQADKVLVLNDGVIERVGRRRHANDEPAAVAALHVVAS